MSETPGDYTSPRSRWPRMARSGSPGPRRCATTGTSTGACCARGAWGKTERWTTHAGPDLAPQLASARGRVLLVWQSLRKDNFDILYRVHQGGAWGPEGFVTENPANDWEPVAAATRDGAFHVAWDTLSRRLRRDVCARWAPNGWGAEMAVAASPRLENHASLAVDERDRVWVAFEIGPEKWAVGFADGGLRPRRDIGLACVANGRPAPRHRGGERRWPRSRGEEGNAGAGARVQPRWRAAAFLPPARSA